jgi:hypothetical protein
MGVAVHRRCALRHRKFTGNGEQARAIQQRIHVVHGIAVCQAMNRNPQRASSPQAFSL